MDQVPNITWIASYPKSGNTWMRSFLASLFDNRPDFSMESLKRMSIQCVSKKIHQAIQGELPHYTSFDEAVMDRPRLLQGLNKAIGARADRNMTRFVKTHSMAGRYRGVPMIPQGLSTTAIFIIRNPFDVCISARSHFGFRNIDDVVRYMHNPAAYMGFLTEETNKFPLFLSSWSNHAISWLRRRDMGVHVFRYEDMMAYPLREFRRVASIAGTEDETKILKALADTDFKNMQELEQKEGFIEVSKKADRFFRSGTVGDGFQQMTAAQRDALFKPLEEICRVFGYHYDGTTFRVGPIDRVGVKDLIRRPATPSERRLRQSVGDGL